MLAFYEFRRRPRLIGKYTHQCMFCQELFTQYPLLHMRMCIKQLDAPLSLLKAYLYERQDYYERFIDTIVEDVLPRNEKTKRLIKPVFRQCGNQMPVHGKYVKFWDMPEVGRTDQGLILKYPLGLMLPICIIISANFANNCTRHTNH